jgi:hypothetical protein
MKRILISLLILSIGLFLTTGCERDTSSALSDEQLEMESISESIWDEENEYFVDWGIDDGSEDNMYDGFSSFSDGISFPKLLEPINNVIRFGRRINHRHKRRIVIDRISPDSIFVKVARVLDGQFVVFQKLDISTPIDSIRIYRKPLRHIVARNSIFVKLLDTEEAKRNPRRRWKLKAISLSDGESIPEPTVKIDKVVVKTDYGQEMVFTNPLETMMNIPEDLPTFTRGEEVTVQAYVCNSTENPVIDPVTGATETVLLHFGINRYHHARRKFVFLEKDPLTDCNIYEGTWIVCQKANRPFHAIVDVIDNGTIYDDDNDIYPYNSVTWGCPYIVKFGE